MDEDILGPIVKSFLGQMDSAMRVSETLSLHESSEEITVDHLITGLVYRLMVPMTDDEVTKALDSAQQILDKLDESDSEEESDEEYIDQNETFGYRKVKTNNCNCNVCTKARVCLLNYGTYDCTDTLSDKFKKAISL